MEDLSIESLEGITRVSWYQRHYQQSWGESIHGFIFTAELGGHATGRFIAARATCIVPPGVNDPHWILAMIKDVRCALEQALTDEELRILFPAFEPPQTVPAAPVIMTSIVSTLDN